MEFICFDNQEKKCKKMHYHLPPHPACMGTLHGGRVRRESGIGTEHSYGFVRFHRLCVNRFRRDEGSIPWELVTAGESGPHVAAAEYPLAGTLRWKWILGSAATDPLPPPATPTFCVPNKSCQKWNPHRKMDQYYFEQRNRPSGVNHWVGVSSLFPWKWNHLFGHQNCTPP